MSIEQSIDTNTVSRDYSLSALTQECVRLIAERDQLRARVAELEQLMDVALHDLIDWSARSPNEKPERRQATHQLAQKISSALINKGAEHVGY